MPQRHYFKDKQSIALNSYRKIRKTNMTVAESEKDLPPTRKGRPASPQGSLVQLEGCWVNLEEVIDGAAATHAAFGRRGANNRKRILVCNVTPSSILLNANLASTQTPPASFQRLSSWSVQVISMPYIQGSPPCYLTQPFLRVLHRWLLSFPSNIFPLVSTVITPFQFSSYLTDPSFSPLLASPSFSALNAVSKCCN